MRLKLELKVFPQTKAQDQDPLLNSIKIWRKTYYQHFPNCFTNYKRKKHYWKHYEADINYPNNQSRVKTQQQQRNENYRPVSLLNADVKSSTNLLQTEFKSILRRSHILAREASSQGDKPTFANWWNNTNNFKDRNQMTISIDTENAFDKVQYAFMIKS